MSNQNNISRKINIRIETISPLHIGNGQRLFSSFDFLLKKDKAYIFDGAEVCANDTKAYLGIKNDFSIDGYVAPSEYDDRALYSYPIHHIPREILSFIKSGNKVFYIPGSSLKGSLRTALLSSIVKKKNYTIKISETSFSRVRAANTIERDILGRTPNEDLFRGLIVRDSEPIKSDKMMCIEVRCYHVKNDQMKDMGPGFSWSVEAIQLEQKINSELVLNLYFLNPKTEFSSNYEDRNRLKNKMLKDGHWLLKDFFLNCRVAVDELITREHEFYSRHNMKDVALFYSELKQKNEKSSYLLLPLGWGAGWQSKTLGMLDLNEDLVKEIQKKYHIGHPQLKGFPLTRRLCILPNGKRMPMGWIQLSEINSNMI